MDKEIYAIYAPFECKACEKAKTHLPRFCKKNGWVLRTIKKEHIDKYDVKTYPTIYATVKECETCDKEIVLTMEGFSLKDLKNNLNKYN